jgi:Ca2+-binding EF-hand superfamily protein
MKRFCMLTGIVLSCSIVATAQDGEKTTDLFKQLDKNNDGKVVADEVSKEQARFFDRLVRLGDADKNGELTQSEFTKATSETVDAPPAGRNPAGADRRPGNSGGQQFDAAAFFKRLDKNGDGKLAKSELPEQFAERLAPAFESLGKDSMTLQEFQEIRQKMDRAGAGQTGGRAGQMGNPAKMFKQLDSNGDGKLTIEEAPEQVRRMVAAILERLGKGRDGSLSQQEFMKAAEQFSRSQQGGRPGDKNRPDMKRDSDRPDARQSDRNRSTENGEMRRPPQGDRPANGGPAFLRILDTNHDGRLSRDELSKAVTLIDRLDQNRDGSLDARELFGPPPGNGQGSMDRPRQNGNNKQSDRPRRPESEDSAKEKSREQKRSGSDEPGRDRRTSSASLDENFGRMDRDKDGAISKDEAPDRLKQNFDRIDSNNDGKVTLDELRKLFDRSRKQ